MIKTVNNLSILFLKKIMQTINGQNHGFWGALQQFGRWAQRIAKGANK
jgi:hypothetical protein